jgi:phytoene dehydrogenase-like protein
VTTPRARLAAAGGRLECAAPVDRVVVRGGRARGVVTVAGELVVARRAVVAACDAQVLYGRLVPSEELPAAFVERLRRFERGSGTVKVDWALDTPIPWSDPSVAPAGTVHVTDGLGELTRTSTQIASGFLPDRPFLLVGQMTTADPTRSPPGTESAWAYTHVPQAIEGDAAGEIDGLDADGLCRFVDRMEERIERRAPGFRSSILARHVQGPADLERADASLVGGDISGGTARLHQQLVFRPVAGLGRAETPIRRLYLGSSSAHPGGGVHGACGANAARAALAHDRLTRAGAVAIGAGVGAVAGAGTTARVGGVLPGRRRRRQRR